MGRKRLILFYILRMTVYSSLVKNIHCCSKTYCIPLSKNKLEIEKRDSEHISNQLVLICSSPLEMKKEAIKLNCQFCHCGAEKLKDLTNLSMIAKTDKKLMRDIVDDITSTCDICIKYKKTDKKLMIDIVDDITSTCDICIKYKKTRPQPAVGLPMASNFNETVAMDLANIGNKI